MATNQFDNYQLDPSAIGSDWAFSGDEVHMNRAPGSKISNPQYYFTNARYSADRTRVTFDYPTEMNPERTIGAGYLGHGVDWSLFNYNPYSTTNPNFRVLNDWLKITGMGGINKPSKDVSDEKESKASGMVAYKNYPAEGYNSFGKKSGGASGDKRWTWKGNTWVPAS